MARPAKIGLAVVAWKLDAHLKRIEADPALNPPTGQLGGLTTKKFFNAGARQQGIYVFVTCASYIGSVSLRRAEAEAYLAWLSGGAVGTVEDWQAACGGVPLPMKPPRRFSVPLAEVPMDNLRRVSCARCEQRLDRVKRDAGNCAATDEASRRSCPWHARLNGKGVARVGA